MEQQDTLPAAMIKQAVDDIRSGTLSEKLAAMYWLYGVSEGAFSFRDCCAYLEIDYLRCLEAIEVQLTKNKDFRKLRSEIEQLQLG